MPREQQMHVQKPGQRLLCSHWFPSHEAFIVNGCWLISKAQHITAGIPAEDGSRVTGLDMES